MTWFQIRQPVFLAIAITGLLCGCAKQVDTTLTIHADGSSTVTVAQTFDRKQLESQLEWHRQAGSQSGEDIQWDEGSLPPDAEDQADADQAPGSASQATTDGDQTDPAQTQQEAADEKLAKDLRAMFEQDDTADRFDQMHTEIKQVQVEGDKVNIVSEVRFDDLEALVKFLPVSDAGNPVQRVRIARTDQGNVRLTVTTMRDSDEMDSQTRRQYVQMIKQQKLSGSVVVVMPGEIVSSTLGETEGARTSLSLNPEDDASIEAFFEALSKPIVIEARPGELAMDPLPLDSDEMEVGWSGYGPGNDDELGDDLPITEPAEPYLAEANSARKVVVHTYPAAKQFQEQLEYGYGGENESGCTVEARIFPPRTRYVDSISSIKILKAVDDQGRPVKPRRDQTTHMTRHFGLDDQEPGQPAQISLDLALPEPDAEAIELIEGEALITSFGRWLTYSVEPVKPQPDKAIDLSDILKGATVTILRTATPRPDESDAGELTEGLIQLRLTGPETIKHLDLNVEIAGFDNIHAYERRSTFQRNDDQFTRNVMLEYRPWSFDEAAPTELKPTLTIRYPDDLQRHRVKFTLEAMDLF